MIARPLPYEEVARPHTGTRSGRTAAHVRRKRTQRRRYAGFARIFTTVGALTIAIVVYLSLMANVTRMNYDLAKSARQKTQLIDEASRLDDRIARLASRERLAQLASRLHMHEARTFAEITLPVERAASVPHGIAFLHWLK